jgi:hypothetical protein
MFRDGGSLDHNVARIRVPGVPLSKRSATARDAGIDDVCRLSIFPHIIHAIFAEAVARRRRFHASFPERRTREDTCDDVSKRFAAYARVASLGKKTRMASAKMRCARPRLAPAQGPRRAGTKSVTDEISFFEV